MSNLPAVGTEVTSICQQVRCGQQFTYIKRNGKARKYCSDACNGKAAKRARRARLAAERPPITRDCRQCGKEFSYPARAGQPRQYCSNQCREAGNLDSVRKRLGCDVGELTLVCQHCGEVFTYVKTTTARRKYCGEQCKATAGDKMRQERAAKRIRFCRVCGGTEDVCEYGRPVCKNCRKENRDRKSENRQRRLRMYGLTSEQFDKMLAKQKKCCAICKTSDPGPRGWHIDHDHGCCPGVGSCGSCVRGVLCKDCNFMIGLAKDSTDILVAATKYLLDKSQYSIPI